MNYQVVADESVDYSIVIELRKRNYNVYAISEQHPSLTDNEVLSVAFELDALLITEDKDFGELVYRFQLAHKGIRMIDSTSKEKAASVCNAIEQFGTELLDSCTVLDDKKIRTRK